MPLSFADLNSVNTIKKIGGSKEQHGSLTPLFTIDLKHSA